MSAAIDVARPLNEFGGSERFSQVLNSGSSALVCSVITFFSPFLMNNK